MSIRIEVAVLSDKGRIRENNEDNFFFNGKYMQREQADKGGLFQEKSAEEHQLYAVCDGMGGAEAGEEASLSAVTSLCELLSRGDDGFEAKGILGFVQMASDRIYTESQQRGGARSGCTIASVLVDDGYVRLLHVGDSRVYLLRGGQLARMTKDHSEVQRMVELNLISEAEARTHPKRNVINQYMGMPPTEVILSPSLTEPEPLQKGDTFLLCSDGVTDMVEDARIGELMKSTQSATEMCKKLVGEALRNGGKDNVTAMCLRVLSANPGSGLRTLRRRRYACLGLIGLNMAAIAVMLMQLLR